ncbi:acetate--CoA ligase [Desulfitibacter alkalitolerans]|uniref:acetate--CoA ligase n=1 Tax=Desulfitibacter alkalitolerans TaxID=264641 RepID=UPI000483F60B|nr:acetate--CoA ligase [Desulfitibacter alkalitolerans]
MEELLREERKFYPSSTFTKQANIQDNSIYETASRDFTAYWEKEAENLYWFKKWDKALEWEPPFAKWFINGKINAAYNCLDRHADGLRKNKPAIIWEGEPGESKTLTYGDLTREVKLFANVLKNQGIQRGDRVTLYMPMIPELTIAMLACARIGAVHSIVFGGFSSQALQERINDCKSKLVITADGGYRRGGIIPLKHSVNAAVENCPSVEKVIVVSRIGDNGLASMHPGRDLWWHELMADSSDHCPAEEMDSEDMLFILYTSGTTGKPKGIVHTTGGYLTGVASTHKMVFDLKEDDIYWCTADIGWITGHSYLVYGPLANGATTIMYEGAPDWPEKDRFWEIIEKYKATIFYTAPTAIRACMKWGSKWPEKRDLSSLRLLGTVGEPINPEAWMWYHKHIGGERCPIVDTWWQTETGQILISPLPGITATKPGSATKPLPGINAQIVDAAGNPVPNGTGGFLVLKSPWPAMLRNIYGDTDRFIFQYWSRFENTYFTGDGAKTDEDGYFWIMGRIDDVINVAGHRIGTMEVESALVDHPAVAEAAVIGRSHELKGQAVVAFITLREGHEGNLDLAKEIKQHVVIKIGALARPEEIFFTELPKTRSGKIMRRLLRDIAENRSLGDTTTLADASVINQLKLLQAN